MAGLALAARDGSVRYKNLRLDSSQGLDIASVLRGLKAIGYDGRLVMHSPKFDGLDPIEYAKSAYDYLRGLIEAA